MNFSWIKYCTYPPIYSKPDFDFCTQAKVWDISRCLLLTTLTGHNAAIFAVDMSEDGSLVITGSADRVREGKKVCMLGEKLIHL